MPKKKPIQRDPEIDLGFIDNPRLSASFASFAIEGLSGSPLSPPFLLASGPGYYAPSRVEPDDDSSLEALAAKLWKKMFDRPVIVICTHCDAAMMVTDPVCNRCGAPAGPAHREWKDQQTKRYQISEA